MGQDFHAEIYDLMHKQSSRPSIDFYIEECKKTSGKVLELGCGTGRVLIPIAREGVCVTGLDISGSMLKQCERKLAQELQDVRERATILQGSMVDFNLGEQFSAIIMPFRAFMHILTVEDQVSCLNCVHKHLTDGGRLVFEVFTFDAAGMVALGDGKERDSGEFKAPDGRVIRMTYRHAAQHPLLQYNDVEMIFTVTHPDGKTERFVDAFPWRYFYRYEVEHLLARTGFKILNLYGGYDRSELNEKSLDMVFVAGKV